MDLFKFSNKLGGTDPSSLPFRIPARELDGNFAKLKPLKLDGSSRQYLLTETPEGWSIKIFPDFPSGVGPFFLAFSGGSLYWTGTEASDSAQVPSAVIDAPSDGKTYGRKDALWSSLNLVPTPPASGTYVLGSENGEIKWLATEACS
jgi:hypothetical protein